MSRLQSLALQGPLPIGPLSLALPIGLKQRAWALQACQHELTKHCQSLHVLQSAMLNGTRHPAEAAGPSLHSTYNCCN